MTGISCTICKNLTRAILSPTVDDFVNLGTSRPRLLSSIGSFLTNGTASYFDPFLSEEINCSICPTNPTQKIHANGKRSSFLFETLRFLLYFFVCLFVCLLYVSSPVVNLQMRPTVQPNHLAHFLVSKDHIR